MRGFQRRRPKPPEKVEPHQLPDGRWEGCRHWIPGGVDPGVYPDCPATPDDDTGSDIGPEPHDHLKGRPRDPT